jgi:hypothetical protein
MLQTVNFKFQPPAIFPFYVFGKIGLIKSCSSFWVSISMQKFLSLRWLVQVLRPPQKSERPPFLSGCSYGIKNYGIEVTFNGMISLLNSI